MHGLRQAVGGEGGLHRRLVHADRGRQHAGARRTAPRPARAGPAPCRLRRAGRAAPGTRRRGPSPVTTARSGSPSASSLAGRRSIVTSVSSLGCDTTSVSRPGPRQPRRLLAGLLDHLGRRQRQRRPVGQHPAAVLLDADRHRFVARAIEVLEDRGRRGHRHLVLARPSAVDHADAQLLHGRDNSGYMRAASGWRLAARQPDAPDPGRSRFASPTPTAPPAPA